MITLMLFHICTTLIGQLCMWKQTIVQREGIYSRLIAMSVAQA